MGRVISIDGWLEAHGKGRPAPANGDVARLERAVARLDPLLAPTRRQRPGIDLETELLAVSGAVSLGRYDDAAERAERLANRLSGLRLQG
jgi:hypothetical protein